MIDSYYRKPYQAILVTPIISTLAKRQVSPASLTIAAMLSGLSVIPLLFYGHNWLAITSLILSGYLDTLDGSLARWYDKTSPVGAVMDIVSDRIVEFSVILGLFLVDPSHRGLISLLMLGSCFICVTSFLVVGVFTENSGEKSFHYSPGIMERTEAFIFFVAMMIFPSSFHILAPFFTLLATLTAAMRVFSFMRNH